LLWDDDDDGVRRDSCGFGRLLIEDGGDEVRGYVFLLRINKYLLFLCRNGDTTKVGLRIDWKYY
jgi:hypothetical protein